MNRFRIACSMLVQDCQGRILLVREADSRVYGKFNLPGGHLKEGESLVACATRELAEETGLSVCPTHLLGLYVQSGGVNFILLGQSSITATTPGHDILSCSWLTAQEIMALPDDTLLRPKKMRRVVSDLLADAKHPLSLMCAVEREDWEIARGKESR